MCFIISTALYYQNGRFFKYIYRKIQTRIILKKLVRSRIEKSLIQQDVNGVSKTSHTRQNCNSLVYVFSRLISHNGDISWLLKSRDLKSFYLGMLKISPNGHLQMYLNYLFYEKNFRRDILKNLIYKRLK